MLDLNTLRKIQALGPNYMADPGQLDAPGDLTTNPIGNLDPNQQQNPLAGLMARAQQQGVQQPPISAVPPQLPVPSVQQATYAGSPIAGLMQPPATSASVPQSRVPDTTMAAGGLMPNTGSNTEMNNRMALQNRFPGQYSGPSSSPSSSVSGGTGAPNIDMSKLRGLTPDPVTYELQKLMQPGNTPIYDEYMRQLMNPPNPANYQPSKMRTAMAALAGLGGNPAMTDYIQHMPEEKAKADYEARLKQLQGGATEEEKMISNKRGIATAEALDQIRSQREDLTSQKYQFNMDKLDKELAEKKREYDITNARLMQDMARKEGDFQAQNAIRDLIAKNTEAYHQAETNILRTRAGIERDRADAYKQNVESLGRSRVTDEEIRREEAEARANGETVEVLFDGQGNRVGIRRYSRSIPGQGSNPNDPGRIRPNAPNNPAAPQLVNPERSAP